MATALDQSTLQRTRDTLGKIIKKPALTDKLLSRPPFRYLHDIITEVANVCISSGVFQHEMAKFVNHCFVILSR